MIFERNIIAYKRYFLDFYENQPINVQDKIEKVLNLIRHLKIIPKKFFKHIEDTKGLYEIKIEYEGNIYRIFSFFDKGNIIILGNANNRDFSVDFLLRAKISSKSSTYSYFYPQHNGNYVCGKNTPWALDFIELLTLTTKLNWKISVNKKSSKTPKTQIEIALRIMKEYESENK